TLSTNHMMQKQNPMDILAAEERVYTPEGRQKLQFSFEFMTTKAFYNQSNVSEKYLIFWFKRASGDVIYPCLAFGSGKRLSLLSAKFLTFLCQIAVEQSRICNIIKL